MKDEYPTPSKEQQDKWLVIRLKSQDNLESVTLTERGYYFGIWKQFPRWVIETERKAGRLKEGS